VVWVGQPHAFYREQWGGLGVAAIQQQVKHVLLLEHRGSRLQPHYPQQQQKQQQQQEKEEHCFRKMAAARIVNSH
jgi:hypothetical protein